MKGNMQLFSVEQQRSQALEAHAASFASYTVNLCLKIFSSLCRGYQKASRVILLYTYSRFGDQDPRCFMSVAGSRQR